MAEESRLAISSAEREVLRVLWDLGAVGVKEVAEQLAAEGSEWTRSTICFNVTIGALHLRPNRHGPSRLR